MLLLFSRMFSTFKAKLGSNKTVEKIVYLDSIFLNIVAVPVLPSPPSPESNVVVYLKKPDPWAFVGNNIELEEADFFPQRRRFGNSFVA